jgi:hypothetical protein
MTDLHNAAQKPIEKEEKKDVFVMQYLGENEGEAEGRGLGRPS